MGEIHISRVPRAEWEDRIKKIKACGVNIVASYLFWLNHEWREGEMDFTGENDIAEFVRLCKENDLLFCLRIGPWCNAEYRNGGFPEWLCKSGIKLCDDNFYNGMEWIIPAKYFFGKKAVLIISEYIHDIYVDVEPKTDISLDRIYVDRV